LAHQKLNARNISKEYMKGLRDIAICQLHDFGILVPSEKRVI
jgi:hypothetical protein